MSINKNKKLTDGAVTTIFNHLNGREDIHFSVLTGRDIYYNGHDAKTIKNVIDKKTKMVKAGIRTILEHLFGEAPTKEK